MTQHDREPADAGDAQTTSSEEETAEPNRTRTRVRSRARSAGPGGAADDAADAGADADAPDADASDADDRGTAAEDDGQAAGQGSRRRRRRGRRGRGRGRGRAQDRTSAEAAAVDAGAEGEAAGPAAAGWGDGADRAEPDAAASDAGAAADQDASGRSPHEGEDAEVEQAIARSGTRVAAKRGRRGGANGNGRRGRERPGGVPEEVRRAILEGPPRTMLVTSREDRTQISVLEDRTVVEHYVTRKEDVTYVGNVYMARVQNVLPGMEAAFLDIGKGRNGVLYAGEVLYDELDLEEGADERIENALKPGQKVLVQVTKDPMGSKGPRLTMHLSLAGRYMVLAPNSELFGISRKLTDKERDRLRRVVKRIKPEEHGVIVRTAAEGATDEQLTADLERLLGKWERVEEAARDAKALTAVYEEPPLVVKVIRDNFGPEFERCIVDDEVLYHQVRDYLDEVAPELLDKVELYGQPTLDARARAAGAPSAAGGGMPDGAAPDAEAAATAAPVGEAPDVGAGDGELPDAEAAATEAADGEAPDAEAGDGELPDAEAPAADAEAGTEPTAPAGGLTAEELAAARERQGELPPLFDAYDVTDQLRKAMGRKVWLPSGGYLIIESTEAMKVIDVNTGRFTGDRDTSLEEVVLKTNLEAAEEIVRQLRLRDMGGIIIIDFIDMLLKANQDQVVRRLKRELLRDRTKTRVSEVSRLGLVQMTRKNVSQGLLESFSRPCEHCEGRGLTVELD